MQGLDQRYYNSSYGRFASPDPGMDNVEFANPSTWNAYVYANGDPANSNDPYGLYACGDLKIQGGKFDGQTFSQVMTGTDGNDLLAQLIWHEGGTITDSDLANTDAYHLDQSGTIQERLKQIEGEFTSLAATEREVTELLEVNGAAVAEAEKRQQQHEKRRQDLRAAAEALRQRDELSKETTALTAERDRQMLDRSEAEVRLASQRALTFWGTRLDRNVIARIRLSAAQLLS